MSDDSPQVHPLEAKHSRPPSGPNRHRRQSGDYGPENHPEISAATRWPSAPTWDTDLTPLNLINY
ncbi:hypothetical protein GCM10011576_37860 [Micromonospora parathelypteridis]|nr:hypothetical protein GCM10011576_37860 [Micromonospora parathelypteridis]